MVTRWRFCNFLTAKVMRNGIGWRDTCAITPLYGEKNHTAISFTNNSHQLIEVFLAARGDGIRKESQAVLHQCNILHFNETALMRGFQKQINAAVFAVGNLGTDRLIALEFNHSAVFNRVTHQAVGQSCVDTGPEALCFHQLPGKGEFTAWVRTAGDIHTASGGCTSLHTAGTPRRDW